MIASAAKTRDARSGPQIDWRIGPSWWRRLWVALAEAERELGIDISEAQIAELRSAVDDIDFTAARFDEQGKKTKNARVTIKHNGVLIYDDMELPHGTPGWHEEGPGADTLFLQNHGNPVAFRNIWVVEKK